MPIDYQAVCKKMEEKKCNVHQEHAAVVVYGGDLKIVACCDAFKTELLQFADREIGEQLQKILDNMFLKK